MPLALIGPMQKPVETITLPLLQHVIGGVAAYTAAATSSHDLKAPGGGQSVQMNAPGSGGHASRASSR